MSEVDPIIASSVELGRQAAIEAAGDFGVGEYRGSIAEPGSRQATHMFGCPHPGYRGWSWAITMCRAARARYATVSEVVLLPGSDSLLAPRWVPWAERIRPGDISPGTLMPTPDNDPRLEPGYTGGELATDADPAEWAQTRAVATELGLGRERVLTPYGRQESAERWMASDSGADSPSAKQAKKQCVSCGYFVQLTGQLGRIFGACANEYSSYDARVVAVDHGCGGHSDLVAAERPAQPSQPFFDTISVDSDLFD